MKGHLVFESSTGTEGGWFAWQDNDHSHFGQKGDICPWGEPSCPVRLGMWHEHCTYSGLHMLETGDYLKIFQTDGKTIIWEGTVALSLRDDVYKNPAATVFGYWVNQENEIGVDREIWAKYFFDQLPCEVEEVKK